MGGKKFPVNDEDWRLLYDVKVKSKLTQLVHEGFMLALFTNQNGIQSGKGTAEGFKQKCTCILESVKCDAFVFVSTMKDIYRKPRLGCWDLLLDLLSKPRPNETLLTMASELVDFENSFFVGDAAGRPANPATGRSKDFKCTDRLFAVNARLKFFTPEQFFLSQKEETFVIPEFNPKLSVDKAPNQLPSNCLPRETSEVVLLVGYPGSGKSTLAEIFEANGYILVSRDKLGTVEKCLKLFEFLLRSSGDHKRIVIDNTNPDKASRSKFLSVLKKNNIPVRCLILESTEEQCLHNEMFRVLTKTGHKALPHLAFARYKKAFEMPMLDEGFADVNKVPFVP